MEFPSDDINRECMHTSTSLCIWLGGPVPVYECYVCVCVCVGMCLSVYVCRNIGLYSDTK